MIRRRFTILLAAITVFTACEENFSPKIDIQDLYAVHCIIGIDATRPQFRPIVYISSVYDVPGLNPNLNEKDPTISGAKVTLSYNHMTPFELQEDTSIVYHPEYPDSIVFVTYNKYNNPYIYYTDSTTLPARTEPLRLDVELPDGTLLHSETKFPRGIFFEYSYSFSDGFHGLLETWKTTYYWTIHWEPHEDQLYFSSLDLSYIIEKDSTLEYHSSEVPMEYIPKNGSLVPVYPSYKKYGDLSYHFESVNRFFRSLGDGLNDGENVIITGLKLNVIQFDRELARYYSSTNGYLDGHSVRLDEQVYSNIEGGIGIFGTYKINSIDIGVDMDYIRELGYKIAPGR